MLLHPSRKIFVDELGTIYDLEENVIEPIVGANGYLVALSTHVHILVAETFLGYVQGSGLTVNHKDGVKTNCEKDNLEVVTYSQNSIHAYQTGLRDDNVVVLVKDLRTQQVQRFYSMNECARSFGINTAHVSRALSPERRGRVWMKHFIAIRESDDWPGYQEEDVGKALNGHYKDILVIDSETQAKEIHQGFSRLAQRTGKKGGSIRMRLIRAEKAGVAFATVDQYDFRYLAAGETYPDTPYFKAEWTQPVPTRTPMRICVVEDGKEGAVIYPSLKEFCELKGFSFNAVSKSVHRKGQYKQFTIKYIGHLARNS